MPISTIGSNSLNQTSDLTINGVTVGEGGGSVSTNTAVGASALAANTSGSINTAIGFEALKVNTTGAENVAVGYRALDANTSGTNSIAVGRNALGANTSGSSNVAVGDSALVSNTTASSNSALGSDALNGNTTGANNVAVGRSALQNNTTASQNTAVGYQAGYTNTLGTNNTFIGYGAGHESSAATTTGYNTAVGAYAGYSLTTGTRNTFIGSFQSGGTAGSGSAVTTGSANSILGAYTGGAAPISATGSNYIVLSDGDGNLRFYGDSSGYFLFGTARTSPRGLLDIPTSGGSGGVPLAISRGGDGGPMVYFYSTNSTTTVIGSIANASNTSTTYNTSSDYRLKENIAPMTGALAKVAQLKPVTYKWKLNGSDGQGFIAHELQAVVPDCVTGEKDAVDEDGNPVHQGIDTSFLVATLTAAIQELKTIVDAQAAEIAELKTKVA